MHLDPEQWFIRAFEIQTLVSGGSMTDCGYFPELFVTIHSVSDCCPALKTVAKLCFGG
jgi:hypothetical protein